MPKRTCVIAVLLLAALAALPPVAVASWPEQQAPSATPPLVRIEVYEDVNVRAGPGTDYDMVGVLIAGSANAITGRTADNQWLRITYIGARENTGWVFRDLVRVIADLTTVPIIAPPPTPTRPPTATLQPAIIAGQPTATPAEQRLPTFTPPAPSIRPTLLPAQGVRAPVAIPPAVLVTVLLVLGSFGGILSLLRSRR